MDIRARTQQPTFASIREPEQRGFIHRRVIGFAKRQVGRVARAVVSQVPGGSLALSTVDRLKGLKRGGGPAIPRLSQFAGPAAPVGFAGPIGQPQVAMVARPRVPSLTAADFQATVGAFGLPAIVPIAMQRVVLDCPPGMVVGKDDLCYPGAVLRRNSQFRKWRSPPKSSISRKDERCLAAVDRVQKKLKTLGKQAGLKVTG